MNNYTRQEKTIEQTKKKQTEIELNFLKNQLNPHFLFNNLNTLYALSIKKSDKASDAILKLSVLLRYLLYESNADFVSFEKEKEIMQAYIDLELLRFSTKGDYQFNIHADKDYNIPPLLWLPVLENIFKHGTRFIANNFHIEYNCTIDNGIMTIASKNYSKPKKLNGGSGGEKVGGIGMTNLHKRLELLYPNKFTIDHEYDNQYYILNIKINIS